MAKLYFFHGPMGGSKTLRLLTTAYNFEEKGIPFLCLKSKIDDRDGVGIIHSRIGVERECIIVDEHTNIFQLIKEEKEKNPELKKILVDECQFLSEKNIEDLASIVDIYDIDVMCYGLRTDFQTNLFPGSKRLFELADTIEEVKSHCGCGGKSIINARFDEQGNLITNGNQIQIGGNDSYRPLCRKCYRKLVKELAEKVLGKK